MPEETILQQIQNRVAEYRANLDKLEAKCVAALTGIEIEHVTYICVFGCGISIYLDENGHSAAMQLIKALGGKFDRKADDEVFGDSKPVVKYRQMQDGISIEIVSGPSPSCRIVETKEVLPPRLEPLTIKKRKLVCA